MSPHLLPLRIFSVSSAIALAVLPLTGCGQPPPVLAAQPEAKAAQAPARVEVVRPERGTIVRSTEQPGQIEASEVTPIHAKVAGYISEWTVNIGDRVTKGQLLARLSDPELDADAGYRRAMVEEAEAKLAQARASEEVAVANLASSQAKLAEVHAGERRADAEMTRWRSEFRRVEQLFSERALTGSLVDETRSKLQASESARDEIDASVKTAEAATRQAQAMLDRARADTASAAAGIKVARFEAERAVAMQAYTKISAPYDGVVIERNAETGALTEPGSRGRPLFIVARDDPVRITVSVPELYATAVGPGDRATIRLPILPGKEVEGKVARTAWTLDPRTRTLRAEIDAPNQDGILRPGLYAYVTIVSDEHPNALTIPTTALIRDGTKTFCVTVVEGKAVRPALKIGLSDGTRVEVLTGLTGGENVVKAYADAITDGQPLDPILSPVPAVKP